jgi:hypothetical protein
VFITGLEGVTRWAASGTIVKRWDDGSNGWAGWHPTLQLTVHDVWVKGGPWNTAVIMRWSAVQDLPDGSPYNNHGVHIIRMRWGKVFDIDANEDSQLVAASLQIWAAHGVNEALAAPILS